MSFGMSIKYGLNLGSLTLRYMENNIVVLSIVIVVTAEALVAETAVWFISFFIYMYDC